MCSEHDKPGKGDSKECWRPGAAPNCLELFEKFVEFYVISSNFVSTSLSFVSVSFSSLNILLSSDTVCVDIQEGGGGGSLV